MALKILGIQLLLSMLEAKLWKIGGKKLVTGSERSPFCYLLEMGSTSPNCVCPPMCLCAHLNICVSTRLGSQHSRLGMTPVGRYKRIQNVTSLVLTALSARHNVLMKNHPMPFL